MQKATGSLQELQVESKLASTFSKKLASRRTLLLILLQDRGRNKGLHQSAELNGT